MHIYIKVPGKVVMDSTMDSGRLQINWMVSIPPACMIAVYFEMISKDKIFSCYNSLQEMSLAHSSLLITIILLLAMLDFNKLI